jgi:hypothetical protein
MNTPLNQETLPLGMCVCVCVCVCVLSNQVTLPLGRISITPPFHIYLKVLERCNVIILIT